MITIDAILTWIGQVIKYFDSLTGNYMTAMLIFALVVEVLLLPFGIKQQKNSIKQAKLRPKEMAIRNKYKGRNDQVTMQKMQAEIQEFYQKENFNPMGGCLPMLIQLPVVIALYNIIINPMKYVVGFTSAQISAIGERITELTNVTVHGSQTIPFIEHIRNLGVEKFSDIEGFTEKVPNIDTLPNFSVFGDFNLGLAPSGRGWDWLLLVPLLVFVTSIVSQKLMRKFMYQAPAAENANMGCSNNIMDITFPLMSAFFAYTMPGAVGVYWIAKNFLTFFKQLILAKLMPLPKFTEEDYKAAEKEINAKAPKNSPRSTGGSGKVVRSLHHIDDEDFEDTRQKALERKAAEKAILDAEKAKSEEKAEETDTTSALSMAPVKDDKKKDEKKKK